MKAVILAAGKGTRLSPYSKILPKPLMPISLNKDGSFKSIIEKLINQIVIANITEIIIIVNYRKDLIKEYLGDGSQLNCKITYITQEKLDGNAGAFYYAQHLIEDNSVLITDCDNYISDDNFIKNMRQFHEHNNLDLTSGVCKVSNINKFAIIKTDELGNPTDIFEKPSNESEWGNLAKSGIMIISNNIAKLNREISLSPNGDYTTTQIIKYCIGNKKYKIKLFSIDPKFNDIGTWDEYIPIFRKELSK